MQPVPYQEFVFLNCIRRFQKEEIKTRQSGKDEDWEKWVEKVRTFEKENFIYA
jgi:uncharacterized membrane protein